MVDSVPALEARLDFHLLFFSKLLGLPSVI